MAGRTLRLTGFVTRSDGGTWHVARLLVSCCAADARALKVEVRGAGAPAADTWVTVTGTWHPTGTRARRWPSRSWTRRRPARRRSPRTLTRSGSPPTELAYGGRKFSGASAPAS
ncbi:TIGR03943 family putative permease subunit [Streptomyces minutiscleroticus]|uniref:TIGR03943 family putative permease subunit n=1 Tax=Streptomyces minutiscleroticus TaxID=68238 RepID=UPI0033242462